MLGSSQFGIDRDACSKVAEDVLELVRLGVQIGLVIGGGNLFRGGKAHLAGMPRVPADQIGMLATLMNALSLEQAFEKLSPLVRVMSAIPCGSMAEPYSWRAAIEYLQKNIVVIFAGGTGNPFFTTDSAAALRALEIQADLLIKATKVDGVYDKDPVKHPDAVRFNRITYSEVLTKKLDVMDAAAIALCRDSALPTLVIDLFQDGVLKKAIFNEPVGTLIT